jgi:hypothetical protein
VEASRIDEKRNPLAHGQPAALMLALDLVGATHLAPFAAHQLIEFGLPVALLPGRRRSSSALGSRDGVPVIAGFVAGCTARVGE